MTIDTEVIWALIAGMLGAIFALSAALAMSARAHQRTSSANAKQSETLIKLNDELQQASDDRQRWRDEREAMETRYQADLARVQQRATEDKESIDRQLSGMNAQLTQERTIRTRHELTIKELCNKVEALEQENETLRGERELLISKVDELQKRLDAEMNSKAEIQTERDQIKAALSKVEREVELLRAQQPPTEDVTAAAAAVIAESTTPKVEEPDSDPAAKQAPPDETGSENPTGTNFQLSPRAKENEE